MTLLEQSGSENIEMVWTYVENGYILYDQKGVDGSSKLRVGMWQPLVRLDGQHEGGLVQQRDDGCTTMNERQEEVESPSADVND